MVSIENSVVKQATFYIENRLNKVYRVVWFYKLEDIRTNHEEKKNGNQY